MIDFVHGGHNQLDVYQFGLQKAKNELILIKKIHHKTILKKIYNES